MERALEMLVVIGGLITPFVIFYCYLKSKFDTEKFEYLKFLNKVAKGTSIHHINSNNFLDDDYTPTPFAKAILSTISLYLFFICLALGVVTLVFWFSFHLAFVHEKISDDF